MTHKEQELETALLAILGEFKMRQIDFKQAVKEIKQAASYHKQSPTTADASVLKEALEKISISRENANFIAAEALSQYYALPGSQGGEELVWKEGKTLVFDWTVLFGKSYNFEGLELMAQETKTPIGRVVIWPDKLGENKKWAFYFEYDGWLKQDFNSEEAVKKAVSDAVKKELADQSTLPNKIEESGLKEGASVNPEIIIASLKSLQEIIKRFANNETVDFNKTVHHSHVGNLHNAIQTIESYRNHFKSGEAKPKDPFGEGITNYL